MKLLQSENYQNNNYQTSNIIKHVVRFHILEKKSSKHHHQGKMTLYFVFRAKGFGFMNISVRITSLNGLSKASYNPQICTHCKARNLADLCKFAWNIIQFFSCKALHFQLSVVANQRCFALGRLSFTRKVLLSM